METKLNIRIVQVNARSPPRRKSGCDQIFNQVQYGPIQLLADVINVKPVLVQHEAHHSSDGGIYNCRGTEGKVHRPLPGESVE